MDYSVVEGWDHSEALRRTIGPSLEDLDQQGEHVAELYAEEGMGWVTGGGNVADASAIGHEALVASVARRGGFGLWRQGVPVAA